MRRYQGKVWLAYGGSWVTSVMPKWAFCATWFYFNTAFPLHPVAIRSRLSNSLSAWVSRRTGWLLAACGCSSSFGPTGACAGIRMALHRIASISHYLGVGAFPPLALTYRILCLGIATCECLLMLRVGPICPSILKRTSSEPFQRHPRFMQPQCLLAMLLLRGTSPSSP